MQRNQKVFYADAYRKEPHRTGFATCLQCRHEWVAISPAGVAQLECPECQTMNGIWHSVIIPEGPVWQCGCGSDIFWIVSTGLMCLNCGLTSEKDEPWLKV